MAEFALESTVFENARAIPSRHTCDGEDVSPPLRWTGLPEATRSLGLVVDDPNAPAGVFTHWVARQLDSRARGLGEASRHQAKAAESTSARPATGPCPPALTAADLVGTYER